MTNSLPPALKSMPLDLELGCGRTKRRSDAVGIDLINYPGVDIVGDALEILRTLPDQSVRSIYSEHFLEHMDSPFELLQEVERVLQGGGKCRVIVPHFSNPAFYSDPTHRTFFGLYTFSYWVASAPYRRKVPQYDTALKLDIVRTRLVFKSSRPFYVRHVFKKAVSFWVNMGVWSQEFYEENLCWMMPCYEVDFLLVRVLDS